MSVESLLRFFFVGGAVAGFVLFWVGGWLTRIAGTWSDGSRRVVLRQVGPLVAGTWKTTGGEQRYSGFVCFGHVRLSRRDYGAQLLKSTGFQDEQIKAVSGAVMGRLRLRLRGRVMAGWFQGRKFSFSPDNGRLRTTSWVPPVERKWKRSVSSKMTRSARSASMGAPGGQPQPRR